MTAAQRKAYEQGASDLDNLDRGWNSSEGKVRHDDESGAETTQTLTS
jgi:hypothetical protein